MSNFDHQLRNIGLRSVAIEQSKLISEQSIGASLDAQKIDRLKREKSELEERAEKAEKELKAAKQEATLYKSLLSKPMHEIAERSSDFKATYELQQELLANWMVSQRAFKELAIEFGIKTGLAKSDVVQAGFATKVAVLNNATKHGNNAEDDEFMLKHSEKLKAKLQCKLPFLTICG